MLGIGSGSINLSLDKTSFSPGDTLNVTVELNLNSEIKAKGLIVTFYGVRESRRKSRTYEIIYVVRKTLDQQKVYPAGSQIYTTQIQVPVFPNKTQPMEGLLGTMIDIMKMFSTPIKWYVEAKLDIPMGFDVSSKIMLYLQGEQIY